MPAVALAPGLDRRRDPAEDVDGRGDLAVAHPPRIGRRLRGRMPFRGVRPGRVDLSGEEGPGPPRDGHRRAGPSGRGGRSRRSDPSRHRRMPAATGGERLRWSVDGFADRRRRPRVVANASRTSRRSAAGRTNRAATTALTATETVTRATIATRLAIRNTASPSASAASRIGWARSEQRRPGAAAPGRATRDRAGSSRIGQAAQAIQPRPDEPPERERRERPAEERSRSRVPVTTLIAEDHRDGARARHRAPAFRPARAARRRARPRTTRPGRGRSATPSGRGRPSEGRRAAMATIPSGERIDGDRDDDRGHRPDDVRRDEPPGVVVEVGERRPDRRAGRRRPRRVDGGRADRGGSRQPLTPLAAIPSTK